MSAEPAKASRRRKGNVTELPTKTKPKRGPKPATAKDLATPPEWLSSTAKALWRQIVPKLDEAYPETLSIIDVPALGLMMEHHAIAVTAAKSMREKGNVPQVVDESSTTKGPVARKPPASQVMRDHGKAFVELARDYAMTLRGRATLNLEDLGAVLPDDGDDGDDLFDD